MPASKARTKPTRKGVSAVPVVDPAALVSRERAVTKREDALLGREEIAAVRDELLRAREEASRAKADLEGLVEQVREANQRLVMATLQAQAMAEEAEQANRLKDDFLATVSHELRTPLNAVLGWSHMLASKQMPPLREPKAVAAIERNASALAHIIDDLLDVSRIIAGTLKFEMQPLDLLEIVQAAIEEVRPDAAAKHIRIDVAEMAPAPMTGDGPRLQQVVVNLLSNAVKFTPEGGAVDVQVRRVDSSVELRVSDSGEGISAEFLPHVFERFRQVDNRTARRHGGLGLGLAIARRLVEIHGGTIRAESPGLGRGATFIVDLPVSPVGGANRPSERTGATDVHSGPLQRLDGIRVLLVEDHEDGREAVTALLEQAGALVTAVGAAGDAVTSLQQSVFDVLVSDIGLPDVDGYMLIRGVRQREVTDGGFLPAVALTGFARREDREHALAAGYQAHLAKPVDPGALTNTIVALVRRQTAV